MAQYKAPLKDMNFLLHDVFKVETFWKSLNAIQEVVDREISDAILNEAAKVMEGVVAPLNREGDEEGASWNEGEVIAPSGFKEAYQTFCEGGWNGLGGNPVYGGMGMPKMLTAQVEEMVQASSMSFGLAPMLTAGACLSINAHGSDELKQKYLPNMYSGTWSGAMDLTEPHAGTDLGIIRTKAEENGDGSYAITGTKIFITWGEHDMADNIIHLVLAKLPDAPAGAKGISLFLVPKILVNDDGSLGERNKVSCGSIEKKMGIKGSATCVMNFDGATGWLVGEINQGLACMFTMMNYERLVVGIQALGASDFSYQSAAEYANERLQSRSPDGIQLKDKVADPIIVHPDVRRMLMDMRSLIEGSRAFSTYVAKWLDLAKFSEDDSERQMAEAMVALLTPVAKAFITDKAFENCVIGQQVFGGHGYIREWGQEQLVRDVRITQIYEGANGIQAMDLTGRKVVLNGGKYLNLFINDVQQFIDQQSDDSTLGEFIYPLSDALETLKHCSETIIGRAQSDPFSVGSAANDFLHLFGITSLAYMWAMMAQAASDKQQGSDDDFYRAKMVTARYYYERHLPLIKGLSARINSSSESLMAMNSSWF
ncbi:acyl-CoA dehydrogenase domain-containing protein [gamma proteobacterium BDW918]|nr:acyl-CoA dehydrogenase domain-containing protein [gamma proteobacterium BDW918]